LEQINRRLAGRLVDHTHNHGADRRIWSATLNERRDLYVYLPPGFNPCQAYPVLIWLHGVDEDERTFIRQGALEAFDAAIAAGRLPPLIIAAPDGSLTGRPSLFGANPLWVNSRAGNFEDYLVHDVWGFLLSHYPIRPERQAHVLGGFSGGGAAAFRVGIRHRPEFGVVFGIHPPLNVRWVDCHGRFFAPFDPNCWGWRETVSWGRQPIGRFYGVLVIRVRRFVYPLFGRGPEAVDELIRNNPIEMIDEYQLGPGELAMYVAYVGKDGFNVTAQVDSFLYRARERGLEVQVAFDPRGRHNWRSARRFLPGIIAWLGDQLAPFGPSRG
jgi:S-formylglutathione hydrolase FrmB